MTRNQDYEGSVKLDDNIAYENGINGLVIHKTTNPNVDIRVSGNKIFMNG